MYYYNNNCIRIVYGPEQNKDQFHKCFQSFRNCPRAKLLRSDRLMMKGVFPLLRAQLPYHAQVDFPLEFCQFYYKSIMYYNKAFIASIIFFFF